MKQMHYLIIKKLIRQYLHNQLKHNKLQSTSIENFIKIFNKNNVKNIILYVFRTPKKLILFKIDKNLQKYNSCFRSKDLDNLN